MHQNIYLKRGSISIIMLPEIYFTTVTGELKASNTLKAFSLRFLFQ